MLYLDWARNPEDFILDKEEKYPLWIKKILYLYRKLTGKIIRLEIEGRNVVVISKFNKRIKKKLDKIFQTDVTKNICVCEQLMENQEVIEYLREKNLNIMDGKWLFQYLICDIAKYICNKYEFIPEQQEITILLDEPTFLAFDTIKRLSSKFKNITVVTTKLRKFEILENEIYEQNGLVLNVTNNFKKACMNSKIIFNFDFDEKQFSKVRFLPDATIIHLEQPFEVNQSNFKGENINYYTVNLPTKYYKIYKKLNNFDSSILYESLIYKKTAVKNIWKEIENDKVQIIALQASS